MRRYIYNSFLLFILSFLVFPTSVLAAERCVSEYCVSDDQIIMYVTGVENEPSEVSYQIGNTPCDVTDIQLAGQKDSIIHTIVLLDNSKSVMTKHGVEIKTLLQEMVANRYDGEYFSIGILGKDVSFLASGTNDYVELKNTIEQIPTENKTAYVIENIYDVLESIRQSGNSDFYRLLVVSDGVDLADVGVSHSELINYLGKHPYPIYTISTGGASNEVTKNLFAISRASNSSYYALEGENATAINDILTALRNDANALRITASIPIELRDGSTKNSKLSINGQNYECEFSLPFSLKEEEEIEEIADAEPEKTIIEIPPIVENEVSETEEKPAEKKGINTILIAVILAFLVIIAVIVVLSIYSKNKKKEEERKKELKKRLDRAYGEDEDGEYTLLGDSSKTRLEEDYEDSEYGTRIIDTSSVGKEITLRRTNNPTISFCTKIEGTVSVGRSSSNKISIKGDGTVSGHHCELFIADGDVYIRNINSSNGTKVNGRKITEPTVLCSGDNVTIGSYDYEVNLI